MREDQVHSTVPREHRRGISPRDLANQLKRLLPDIQGSENAKTSAALMKQLGFVASGTNQRLRAAMKVLLHEDGIPVVGNHQGFFVAIRARECLKCAEECEARAMANHRDARDHRLAAQKIQPRQEKLL